MELPGTEYLFNLSLIAMTFAAISVLVMLMRQTMGGRLTNFDVYLMATYISGGAAVGVSSVLPPLVALFDLSSEVLWPIAGGLATIIQVINIVSVQRRRTKAVGNAKSPLVIFDFTFQWVVIAALAANAFVPSLHSPGLYAAALTASMAGILWSFVRRISSLMGQKPGEDWDPKRG